MILPEHRHHDRVAGAALAAAEALFRFADGDRRLEQVVEHLGREHHHPLAPAAPHLRRLVAGHEAAGDPDSEVAHVAR